MKQLSNIVFTKNRPLQLHAYLESLYRYFPSQIIRTYILYKVDLFQEQYNQLFSAFPDGIIVRETDFHTDFLRILSQVDTKYILFGIDDVVYFDTVDFDVIDKTFEKFPGRIFGFSLRFNGRNLKTGGDFINEATVAGQTVYSINWTTGRTPTTRYPFELCATVYLTSLVKKIIESSCNDSILFKKLFLPSSAIMKTLSYITTPRSLLKSLGYFYSPNTLESWNCRWCQHHSNQLPDCLFFQKRCASAVQVNTVNISTPAETAGPANYTIDALAKKYGQGYRLDIDFLAKNAPAGTHADYQHFKLVKTPEKD